MAADSKKKKGSRERKLHKLRQGEESDRKRESDGWDSRPQSLPLPIERDGPMLLEDKDHLWFQHSLYV